MVPKLVFSDVDGTLLKPGGELSAKTKSVIAKLKDKGIPFILVSARSPQEMFELYKTLELTSPVISYNGGMIFEMHDSRMNVLTDYTIQRNEVKAVFDTITGKYPSLNVNIYSGTEWFAERHDEWLQMEIDLVKLKPKFCKLDDVVQNEEKKIHKIMLIGDDQTILEAEKTLKANKKITSSIHKSSANYLEITNTMATKENGVKAVLKTYYPDIKPEEIMAIGDGHNDWGMLEYAGFGVAMGNAPEDMKAALKYITVSNAEDGLAQAVEKLVLQKL